MTTSQVEFGVSKATASLHRESLADMGVLEKVGTTGKGTHYVLRRKGLTKGSKNSAWTERAHKGLKGLTNGKGGGRGEWGRFL